MNKTSKPEIFKVLYIGHCQCRSKKENIENLQKKLGEVLGLERAAQKAVDELIAMKLIKSDSKDEVKEIQGEASSHEEKIQQVVSAFSGRQRYETRCEKGRRISKGNTGEGN